MLAYCVKCKENREMQDTEAVFTKTGTPTTKGVCSVCDTKMSKFGKTAAHEHLTPPPKIQRKKRVKSQRRSGRLVIVESPAKASTIERYLGKGYKVRASVGHIRDLLRSQLSVDVENNFEPKYRVPNDKRSVVKDLKLEADRAAEIYLATDLDREGEAIAWHLKEAMLLDEVIVNRVVFNEITKSAIEEAFAHPRKINMDLVNAQQGRRILDRLVGYKLSPLLWRKVRGRLSAGRVQSVALRLIVERERRVLDFKSEEFWNIRAELLPLGLKDTYLAKLSRIDGESVKPRSMDEVTPILADMSIAEYIIKDVKRGTRRKKPAPPFITSTLQQDASRRLNFTARKSMRIAQQLYEGIDLGGDGPTGLITYMRTDSTNVSASAVDEARKYILGVHGAEFLPAKAPSYRTKSKRAQEAHEAIRPSSVVRTPAGIKKNLTRDQYRLYQLIWKRFIASQMKPAVYDTLKVDVEGKSKDHSYDLSASAQKVKFMGYRVVYEEAKPKDADAEREDTKIPEKVEKGQKQILKELHPEQKFTQPPPRYSEATLVRELEKNGIGRPSTYAPILGTLQQRGYVTREGRSLSPTDIGFTVSDLLSENFPKILDVGFTAQMELELDQVASGERTWTEVVEDFYTPFAEKLEHAFENIPKVEAVIEKVGRACPDCENDLIIRHGRHGKFIGCSNFPACRYTERIITKIDVECPKDGGDLVQRRSRKGSIFFGCNNYPDCDFTSRQKPIKTSCSQCGGLQVMAGRRKTKCTQCGFQVVIQ